MSDNPITRDEMFLSAAAGNDVPLPEPVTRQERFLKAIADNAGGSGGGGLPSVTGADVGRALVVGSPTKGAVIVPEQTLATDEDTGEAVITNEILSLFTDGTYVIATINGNDYVGVVNGSDDPYNYVEFFDGDKSYWFGLYEKTEGDDFEDVFAFYANVGNTFTVSLNVAEYGWSAGYPMPLVCHVNNDDGSLDRTWQEVHDALAIGRIVNAVWVSSSTGVTTWQLISTRLNNNNYQVAYRANTYVWFWFSNDPNANLLCDDW